MLIRDETTRDIPATGPLITAAFLTAPHASGTEAAIVTRLRGDNALALSLVAEEDGAVIGHIAASQAQIGGAGGWSLIGPLAVLPARQRQGVGSALMQAALLRLKQSCRGVTLVGDPVYYSRFGFRSFDGLTWPGIPPEYVLALPFDQISPAGTIGCHPAFGPGPDA